MHAYCIYKQEGYVFYWSINKNYSIRPWSETALGSIWFRIKLIFFCLSEEVAFDFEWKFMAYLVMNSKIKTNWIVARVSESKTKVTKYANHWKLYTWGSLWKWLLGSCAPLVAPIRSIVVRFNSVIFFGNPFNKQAGYHSSSEKYALPGRDER